MSRAGVKKLKIAVHHNLEEGGALRALRAFSVSLEGRYDVRWALLEPDARHDTISSDAKYWKIAPGSPFYYFHKLTDLRNLRESDRAAKALARSIDREDFDVAFLHPCRFGQAPSLLQYLATPAVYYCNEPLRQYREDVPFEDGASRSWGMRAGRALFHSFGERLNRRDVALANRAARIVTNSAYSAEQIRKTYGRSAAVVPPGIDTALYRPLPAKSRRKSLLTVGKLVERKGHFLAVRIVASIPREKRPPLVAAGFRGSASFRKRLEREAAEGGVDLTGLTELDDRAMVAQYNQALLTLAVSRMEPLGLVALESQSCGTPVAALDEAGHRETVIPGTTGILMSDDPVRCALEIEELLSDREKLESLGRAGRAVVEERWSVEKAGENLCAVMEEFAGGK